MTRTTAAGGNLRTLTGPQGNAYAVNHSTYGLGTWDASVSPVPTNGGVIITCGSNGCAGYNGGHTLVISSSHISGTVDAVPLYDHTVSTGSTGLTMRGSGVNRVVNGSVRVQDNLAQFTSTTTFKSVGYGIANCCFSSTGIVTMTLPYPLIKLCRNKNSIKIILIFMSIIQIEQCFKFENRCDLRVCFG